PRFDDGGAVGWRFSTVLVRSRRRGSMFACRSVILILSTASWCAGPAIAAEPPAALVRLGESRFRAGANLNCVAYSPDGKLIAAADENETVVLWHAAIGLPAGEWHLDRRNVLQLRFSPDSTRLAGVDSRGFLNVWNIKTRAHRIDESALRFSPDAFVWTSDSKKIIAAPGENNKNGLAILDGDTLADSSRPEQYAAAISVKRIFPTSDASKFVV